MNIGFDARVLTDDKCGISNYLSQLIRGLVHRYDDVHVYLFAPQKIEIEYAPFLRHKRIHQVILHLDKRQRKRWPSNHMARLVKENNIDIFHQPFNANHSIFWCPCPMVLTMHDLIPWIVTGMFSSWRKRWIYKIQNIVNAHLAKHIVVNSMCTRDDIARLCLVPKQKMTVTYLGADEIYAEPLSLDEQHAILNKYHLDDKTYVINMSGFGQVRRNPNFILEGFAQFLKDSGEDAYLVVTGSVLKYQGFYERLVRKMAYLEIQDRVITTGFLNVKELKVILSHAKVSVVTSLYEGFCLPATETFSCGVPLIANDRGSIPEVVGDAGILIDPYEPRKLSESLHELFFSKEMCDEYIAKGYDRIKQFSWDTLIEKTYGVYQQIMNSQ